MNVTYDFKMCQLKKKILAKYETLDHATHGFLFNMSCFLVKDFLSPVDVF